MFYPDSGDFILFGSIFYLRPLRRFVPAFELPSG
jgi:hypothetical protein